MCSGPSPCAGPTGSPSSCTPKSWPREPGHDPRFPQLVGPLRQHLMAGLLVAATLGLIGVVVLARDQIFIWAALSRSSTLCIAIALCRGAARGGPAARSGGS